MAIATPPSALEAAFRAMRGSSQESAYKIAANRLLAENRRLQKEVRELRQKLAAISEEK